MMRLKRAASLNTGRIDLGPGIAICILFFLNGCSNSSSQPSILFFAAASSNEAITEIFQSYQSQDQETVSIRSSFAGSSTLATQILNGADADLFLSANLEWVEKLKEAGEVEKVNRIIGNQLVVITSVNRDDSNWLPSQFKDLADQRIKRIAIADPDSVPAGIYAKNAMNKLNIWQTVSPKLIYGTDVRQTLAQVENTAVEFGIVYRTDAKISSNVQVVFEIPVALTGPIDYGLVMTTRGHSNPFCRRLFDFLVSANSKQIFEKHGFQVAGENE